MKGLKIHFVTTRSAVRLFILFLVGVLLLLRLLLLLPFAVFAVRRDEYVNVVATV